MAEATEQEYYPKVLWYLNQSFQVALKARSGSVHFHAQIIADSASAQSGKWETPDLLAVSVWRPNIVSVPQLSVHTFEIKRASTCDITAVHQALAHARFSNYVYLGSPCEEEFLNFSKRRNIEQECTRYGVGLIWLHEPENVDSYKIAIPAQRHNPTPFAVDEFLTNKLNDDDQNKIRSWTTPIESF